MTDADSICVSGRIEDVQYHGASSRIELELPDALRLVVSINNDEDSESSLPAVGESVFAAWSREAMVPLRGQDA